MLDKTSLTHEASIGVTYSSLMSAVSLFFTGVLISQYATFGPTIKIPLAFLIISTFSFIFSATIYMNAGTEIALNKLQAVEKYMVYGKNIMELLGLYLFVMAMPLVIGALTNDSYLRLMTVVVTIVSFGLYSQSRFSILEKELTILRKRLLSLLIVSMMILLYSLQNSRMANALEYYAGVALLLLLTLTFCGYYFSTRSKQYKQTRFRPFSNEDAPRLSAIIGKNLAKARLGRQKLKELKEAYSPERLVDAAKKHHVIVAEFNDQPAGLVVLDKHEIVAVFTDSSLHRKGIGRMLVAQAETEAWNQGMDYLEVSAAKIEQGFYKRLDYKDTGKTGTSQAVMELDEEYMRGMQQINPGMLALIDNLRAKGLRLGLLSNNSRENAQHFRTSGLADHFDVVHVSAETGLVKPEHDAFTHFADELGVELSELIYIDDSQVSLSTAHELGYTPILFENYDTLKIRLTDLGITV